MEWYATRTGGEREGLVCEMETGRNVAVSYEKKDAALIAAAPEMYRLIEELAGNLNQRACQIIADISRAAEILEGKRHPY